MKAHFTTDEVMGKNIDAKLPCWENADGIAKYLRPFKLHKSNGMMTTKYCDF